MYTHPATFGRPGQPVSRKVTVPVTVGTREAFAHDCHAPLTEPPVGPTNRTAPREATGAASAARVSGRPPIPPRPASTTIATTRRSTERFVPQPGASRVAAQLT